MNPYFLTFFDFFSNLLPQSILVEIYSIEEVSNIASAYFIISIGFISFVLINFATEEMNLDNKISILVSIIITTLIGYKTIGQDNIEILITILFVITSIIKIISGMILGYASGSNIVIFIICIFAGTAVILVNTIFASILKLHAQNITFLIIICTGISTVKLIKSFFIREYRGITTPLAIGITIMVILSLIYPAEYIKNIYKEYYVGTLLYILHIYSFLISYLITLITTFYKNINRY